MISDVGRTTLQTIPGSIFLAGDRCAHDRGDAYLGRLRALSPPRHALIASRIQDDRAMLEAIDGFPGDPVRFGPPPDDAEGRHVQSR
jgi:hypothetical protein